MLAGSPSIVHVADHNDQGRCSFLGGPPALALAKGQPQRPDSDRAKKRTATARLSALGFGSAGQTSPAPLGAQRLNQVYANEIRVCANSPRQVMAGA